MYWLKDNSSSLWRLCRMRPNSASSSSHGDRASRIRFFTFDADDNRYATRAPVIKNGTASSSTNMYETCALSRRNRVARSTSIGLARGSLDGTQQPGGMRSDPGGPRSSKTAADGPGDQPYTWYGRGRTRKPRQFSVCPFE